MHTPHDLFGSFIFLLEPLGTNFFGTRYGKDYVIVAGLRHGIPVFGEINLVLILNGSEFQYKTLRVTQYVVHPSAYKVERQNEMCFVKQSQLEDFHPLGICKGFGCYASNSYIVLKYRVDCLQ